MYQSSIKRMVSKRKLHVVGIFFFKRRGGVCKLKDP